MADNHWRIAAVAAAVLIFQIASACLWTSPTAICCANIADDVCFGNEIAVTLPKCPIAFTHQFILYVRSNSQTGIPFYQSSIPAEFSNDRTTIFIIHGLRDFFNANFKSLKDKLLTANDYNVVAVDWRGGAGDDNYVQSAANTRPMGALMGRIVNNMRQKSGSSPYYWCIGHGLGAHICAFTDKTISQSLDRITGLDPAAASFLANGLRSSSAKKVDVIHTDPVVGLTQPRGTVDFYPNGGRLQPGCSDASACNHQRAVDYMITTIENPTCFQANQTCTYYRNIPSSCQIISDSAQFGMMGFSATSHRYNSMLYMTLNNYTAPYCSKT